MRLVMLAKTAGFSDHPPWCVGADNGVMITIPRSAPSRRPRSTGECWPHWKIPTLARRLTSLFPVAPRGWWNGFSAGAPPGTANGQHLRLNLIHQGGGTENAGGVDRRLPPSNGTLAVRVGRDLPSAPRYRQ